MKKVKKLVSLLMALSMVFSLLAVSASAATPPDDPGISPLGIIESRPYNLNPYDISQSIPFVVGKNFTFWKIHIRTEGTYYINVNVRGGQSYLQGTLWYKTASTQAEAM